MKKSVWILPLFVGVAFLLRWGSFVPSVIDHDESTYIVIADALLQGYTYQVDYIDTKPIGIFWVYALIQWVFGGAIYWFRIVAALTIAATSYLLYRAHLHYSMGHRAGLAAGLIYLFFNSIYTTYGVSPNTETYFNFFTAAALLLYLRKGPLWQYFLAGLLLGLGFVLKYVVLFDGLAFGLFLLWQAWRKEEQWRIAWGRSLLMAVGAALPFLGVMAYYHQIGHWDTFWFHSFTVSGRYPSSNDLTHYLIFPLEFFGRYLPITVFAALAMWSREVPSALKRLTVLWGGLVLFAILLLGNAFGHYFIQLMLPMSFLAGTFFAIPADSLPRWIRWARQPRIGYALLGLFVVIHLFLQKKDYIDKPDNARVIARYLNERLEPDDQIYTKEGQILYHLTDRLPLIRYVHPSLFWKMRHVIAMEIPLDDEIAKVTEAKPRFMVFRLPLEERYFPYFRREYYLPVHNVGTHSTIFELKPKYQTPSATEAD